MGIHNARSISFVLKGVGVRVMRHPHRLAMQGGERLELVAPAKGLVLCCQESHTHPYAAAHASHTHYIYIIGCSHHMECQLHGLMMEQRCPRNDRADIKTINITRATILISGTRSISSLGMGKFD